MQLRDRSGTRMRADCSQHCGRHEGSEVRLWRVMKEATASFLGTVTEAVRGDFFRVALDSGHSVLAKPAGKLQVHHIRLAIGDRVKVEISPYDPERGRIIQRL
jgi:translation initiation factor IF-1